MEDAKKMRELLEQPGLDMRARLCIELAAAYQHIKELEDRLDEAQSQLEMLNDAYKSVAGCSFSARAVRPLDEALDEAFGHMG